MIDFDLLNKLNNYNSSRYNHFKNHINFNKNKDYERLLCARYMKVSRLKKHFVYLISRYKYLYFVTFTFDDDLLKCCERTQKDYMKKCLISFDKNIKYILNADYGTKTERLHYHCICATNVDNNLRDFVRDNYPCRSNVKLINVTKSDIDKLSKYIDKLTNHCIKDSTKKRRIIYNFKGYEDFCPTLYDEFIIYTHEKDLLGIS